MSPFRGDIIHGSVQLSWYLKHFFDALAGRAFRNKILVEKGEQLRKTAYVLIRRAYFGPFKIQIDKPNQTKTKQNPILSDSQSQVREGNLVDLRVLWSTLPHSRCGSSVSGHAVCVSMCPPSPPGAARKVRWCEESRDGQMLSHGWGQTWSPEGLRTPVGEQVPTARPVEEETGRSQKAERKERGFVSSFCFFLLMRKVELNEEGGGVRKILGSFMSQVERHSS